MSTTSPSPASPVWGWLPWILFFGLARMGQPHAGAYAGLLLALYPTAARAARGLDVKLPDWMTLVFFVIAAAAVLLGGFVLWMFWKYSLVIVWVLFAGMAWVSMLSGAPFTLQFAREVTPPDFWEHPLFLRTAVILTLMWAAIFTLNLAIAAVALGPVPPRSFAVLLPTLTVVAGFIFTARYAAAINRRATAAFSSISQ